MADINNNYKDFKNLTPFKMCVLQNFPFIEADFDAVTNYQLLCKVVEYLNNVIDNNNTQNENIKRLEDNFITLYNYVKNYFDNLDVQEEINNKLDEMAASGELSEVLSNYLNLFRFFNTTTELINENSTIKIQSGYLIETLGYYEINDKGGGKFFITNDRPDDKFYIELKNGLYAILLSNNALSFGFYNDGVNDNTEIFNKVIKYNDYLFFPSGIYLFNKIEINKDFKIIGEDKNKTILKCNNQDFDNSFNFISLKNGCFIVKNITINSSYVGINTTLSLVNTNNSIIKNCIIEGSTAQRTLNLQTFNKNYGYNNLIAENEIFKKIDTSISGALILCTGELDNNNNLCYLTNTRIINNKCICSSSIYTGDSDLFDCIELDNVKNSIIENNYCENSLHNGISLDTRNVNTLCTNNICISTSTLSSGSRNGIEITGVNGNELQSAIISNNIIEDFYSNGISLNAPNTSVINNKIRNSNRGIIILELAINNNLVSENNISSIKEYGIYVSGKVSNARIINNTGSIYVGDGSGNLLYIISPNSSTNNIIDGLSRIVFYNGIHKNDNYRGLTNNGIVIDMLSDGRCIYYDFHSKSWKVITSSDI